MDPIANKISFVNPVNAPPRTRRIPEEVWEVHKDAILSKFKGKPLYTVQKEMQEQYGFVTTYVFPQLPCGHTTRIIWLARV